MHDSAGRHMLTELVTDTYIPNDTDMTPHEGRVQARTCLRRRQLASKGRMKHVPKWCAALQVITGPNFSGACGHWQYRLLSQHQSSSAQPGACWPREELLRQAGRPHRVSGSRGLLRPRQGRAHRPDRPHLHAGACTLCMASERPTCARCPHAHGTGCAPAQVACREAATVPQSAFLIDLSQISSMLRNSTPKCAPSLVIKCASFAALLLLHLQKFMSCCLCRATSRSSGLRAMRQVSVHHRRVRQGHAGVGRRRPAVRGAAAPGGPAPAAAQGHRLHTLQRDDARRAPAQARAPMCPWPCVRC